MSRLEDLELLVAVVEHGNFSLAASHLGTTQSRVSRAIARLEDNLGLVLVKRSPRRVSPTDEGRRLAEHTRRMLDELTAVEASLRDDDGMVGSLVLSTPPALGRRLIAPSLAHFCAANPDVRVDWSLGARRVDLIAESVDVAVRFGPLAPTWERAQRLIRGGYQVYAAPSLATQATLPEALGALPCLGLHVTHRRDRWPLVIDGEVRWWDVDPVHWTDDVDALIALAVGGLGLAMLPEFLVRDEEASGALVRLTPPGLAVPAEVFVNLGYQKPTARARALAQHLLAALAS
ncbi:MAG: LysR family transcriptional regulator [Deltaproteobacteria bacterium]|nr:MAG: LysR family transcriptional regulator [Deltaproteobacteria bacterium]